MGSEEKESSEHPEDQISEKSECREVDVEFPVACADRKDFEHSEYAHSKDVDRPHIEVVSLIDLAELSNLFGVEILFAGAVPKHVLDVKWIAVGRLEDFPSIELWIDDVQRVVVEEVVDKLHGNRFRQRLQLDLCE